MDIVYTKMEVVPSQEKLKGYWDDTGKFMNIAIKSDQNIAICTPYWDQTHYIPTYLNKDTLWLSMKTFSDKVGRKLVKSNKGKYVYIDNINCFQLQDMVSILLDIVNVDSKDMIKCWELSWDIADAYLP